MLGTVLIISSRRSLVATQDSPCHQPRNRTLAESWRENVGHTTHLWSGWSGGASPLRVVPVGIGIFPIFRVIHEYPIMRVHLSANRAHVEDHCQPQTVRARDEKSRWDLGREERTVIRDWGTDKDPVGDMLGATEQGVSMSVLDDDRSD